MTDANKLLIAAKVHEIAEGKRNAARRVGAETATRNNMRFLEGAWNDKNPVQNFVPEAINELRAIETIIWPPAR